jgi:hypothetical protein
MIENIVERLKVRPETYKTLLGKEYGRNTVTTIVSRKMNRLLDYGDILHGVLDGTRFGERIFFSHEKKYYVIIFRTRAGFEYYYCSDIKRRAGYVTMVEAFALTDDCWRSVGSKTMNCGNMIRWF